MKKLILLVFILFSISLLSHAQNAATPKAPPSTKVQRKMARKKWKENRRIKRDGEKNIQEHDKRIQTKKTRKKMRQDRAKSKALRDNKGPPFYKKWFSRKR